MGRQPGLPEYPDSRKILVTDKAAFEQLLRQAKPETSEMTFLSLFMWGEAKGYTAGTYRGHILVHYNDSGVETFLPPVGPESAKVIGELLAKRQNLVFSCIPEKTAAELRSQGIPVSEDRAAFDYVYNREDLAELKGARYAPKRSFIKRALANHEVKALSGDEIDPEKCMALQKAWATERQGKHDTEIGAEEKAMEALVKNKKHFDVLCVALEINGKIAAFSAGEPLNERTFVVHFEKARPWKKGLYQLVNNEFAKRVPEKYAYINREEDLGIPGLRKAKESYHPAFMAKKYRATAN